MYDELMFIVEATKATKVERVSLTALDLQERAHLQEWILANPEVIGPGAVVVTSEFDRWQTAAGAPVQDRLDILALDADGRLVVVELKRDAAPHTIHMQAINYAAMVSRLTPEDIADLYASWSSKTGTAMDRASALTLLETQQLLSVEGIRSPRIVLVASDFPASVTASVVWLNEQRVDISLIRFRAYQVNNKIMVSFSRLYPVPEVEEFTIGRRVDSTPLDSAPGPAWDEASLRRLAAQANPATLAMLDLCALEDPEQVGVQDIAEAAGITAGGVRGQLAGLTMRLRNPTYGFRQQTWPTTVQWLPGGVASYSMAPELAAVWRSVRGEELLSKAGPGGGSAGSTDAGLSPPGAEVRGAWAHALGPSVPDRPADLRFVSNSPSATPRPHC